MKQNNQECLSYLILKAFLGTPGRCFSIRDMMDATGETILSRVSVILRYMYLQNYLTRFSKPPKPGRHASVYYYAMALGVTEGHNIKTLALKIQAGYKAEKASREEFMHAEQKRFFDTVGPGFNDWDLFRLMYEKKRKSKCPRFGLSTFVAQYSSIFERAPQAEKAFARKRWLTVYGLDADLPACLQERKGPIMPPTFGELMDIAPRQAGPESGIVRMHTHDAVQPKKEHWAVRAARWVSSTRIRIPFRSPIYKG